MNVTMSDERRKRIVQMLRQDRRYTLEAYSFVGESLAYAQHVLGMGGQSTGEGEEDVDPDEQFERHLTGQQLCEAIRLYALEQFGYMAKVVLNSWGVHCTGDFGEIVYNWIRIGEMKKSDNDRREDFDDVYDFDEAFLQHFEITIPEQR
jgi:uncharacterized repeat protein (TIGR04138 family)